VVAILFKKLLRKNFPFHQFPLTARAQGTSPFFAAAANGHLAIVKTIFAQAKGAVALNHLQLAGPFEGMTPIYIAAEKGNVHAVSKLAYYADVNVRMLQGTTQGQTALHIAYANGHMNVVKFLRRNGAIQDEGAAPAAKRRRLIGL